MDVELPDGTIVTDVPEGTTQKELMARLTKMRGKQPSLGVQAAAGLSAIGQTEGGKSAVQSGLKGLARVPDMFLSIPANLFNLGSAAIGTAAGELGRPDITARMPIAGHAFTQPVESGLEAAGLTSPETAPKTTGQRIIGKGLETAPSFLLSPGKAGTNLATGLISGITGQATEEATGSKAAGTIVSMLTPSAVKGVISGGKSILEPVRKNTLKQASKAGYVVAPSAVKPTFATNRIESAGARAAVEQKATLMNQATTNKLAAKALGLAEDTPLAPDVLKGVKDKAAVVFKEADALTPPPSMPWFPRFHETKLGTQLQKARAEAHELWMTHKRTPHPDTRVAAEKMDQLADSIQADIGRIANASGKPEFVKQLSDARTLYAKASDVERAIIPGTGDVSASKIGDLLRGNKQKYLSGELKTIAKFAKAFPKYAKNAVTTPNPDVSGTDALTALTMGTIGLSGQNPSAALTGFLPLLRSPMRGLALSSPMQARLLREPPSLSTKGLESLLAGRAQLAPPESQ